MSLHEQFIPIALICTFFVFMVFTSLMGLILVIIQIWSHLKPKTDNFATVKELSAINAVNEDRYQENRESITEIKRYAENHFRDIHTSMLKLDASINEIGKNLAVITAQFLKDK